MLPLEFMQRFTVGARNVLAIVSRSREARANDCFAATNSGL
jgi:hypothetical protein